MSDEPNNLPVTEADLSRAGFGANMKMSKGLAIFFNDPLYNRCKQLASALSRAEGTTPKHLLGKPEACFAVISRAITWNLDPVAVMALTYQTPGGAIGYMGVLIQAILENSGHLEGRVNYELFGPWEKVRGKFKWETSPKGHKYAVSGWDETKAEEGIGVRVFAKVRGEVEPRSEGFMLNTFWPRNSTLWALRPEQQIRYAACRAFANIAMPGIMLGVPFDIDTTDFYGEPMTDVTPPRPTTSAFDRPKPAVTPPATDDKTGGAENDTPAADASQEAANQAENVDQSVGAKNTEKPADDGGEEAIMARGQRLLAGIGTTNDVADLRLSIQDELEAQEDMPGEELLAMLAEWRTACDARAKKITTPPAKAGKGKVK